jgi:hypothetical protein
MAKRYTLALDVSPSEQFSGNLQDVKTMGVVVGLKRPSSFQEVGAQFPEASQRQILKKWSRSSQKYKKDFVEHMANVVATGNVICGFCHSNEANMLGVLYQKYFGKFPEPSSTNKKGKPRIQLGGYLQDGELIPPFEVLAFDLCTIGWIAAEVLDLLQMIDQTNGEKCSLDVIADRIPNEQGGEKYLLSSILRALLSRASDSRVDLVGVPNPREIQQRELFVDNVAGLANLCLIKPDSDVSKLVSTSSTKLFGISRSEDKVFLDHFKGWFSNR